MLQNPFAAVTPQLQAYYIGLCPCAQWVHQWLLQATRPWTTAEFDFNEFNLWIERSRGRKYSLRQFKRALEQLQLVGLVETLKQYSARIYRFVVGHPDPLCCDKDVKNSASMSYDATSMSKKAPSNPYALVPRQRDLRDPTNKVDEQERNGTDISVAATVSRALAPLPISPQLQRVMEQHSAAQVLRAVSAYQETVEAQKTGGTPIKNPQGWLIAAIRSGFSPNKEKKMKNKAESVPPEDAVRVTKLPADFDEWYRYAHKAKIASASQIQDGKLLILSGDTWIPYQLMLEGFPLDAVKRLAGEADNFFGSGRK